MDIEVGAEHIKVTNGSGHDPTKEVAAATDVPGPADQSTTAQAGVAVLEFVDNMLFNLEREFAGEGTKELHGHGGETRDVRNGQFPKSIKLRNF